MDVSRMGLIVDPAGLTTLGIILVIWILADLILRGLALWSSARHGHKWWFFFLFIINSLGILPIIYLVSHVWSKKK
jgi:hypothetical protein